jgi:peroxiredoxin Q/BCP
VKAESKTASAAKTVSKKPAPVAKSPAKASVKASAITKAPSPTKATKAHKAPAVKAAPASAGALTEGKKAPAFELADQNGTVVSSASLAGKPYVLYFYPKDNTPGCTVEACDFRDNFARFEQTKVRVFGVSPDSSKSHAGFAAKFELPFTLLADADKSLVNAYGVWVKKLNYGREYMGVERSTFLVGADGAIKKVWRNVKVKGHVDQVLAEASSL